MLEVLSLEVMMDGTRTVTGMESWRKRIPDFGDMTVKLQAPNAVQTNGTVSRLLLDDHKERTGS